ncbi:hypothetical protein MtrunA17_Chr1g0179931 [Medicago truncatula]|uniref:Uncharacterized protein n=1 Tax=Medicago truncatula TaxID=3880 RepID=A0A396JYG7_MEDTR|nr:hypothetical protein MtrunA17_Chr1g0179931 [Medicago truncatula]
MPRLPPSQQPPLALRAPHHPPASPQHQPHQLRVRVLPRPLYHLHLIPHWLPHQLHYSLRATPLGAVSAHCLARPWMHPLLQMMHHKFQTQYLQ